MALSNWLDRRRENKFPENFKKEEFESDLGFVSSKKRKGREKKAGI